MTVLRHINCLCHQNVGHLLEMSSLLLRIITFASVSKYIAALKHSVLKYSPLQNYTFDFLNIY